MTDAELAALADADPTTLPAAMLLDGYVDALRRAPLTSPGPELGRAVALRAELLRRLTLGTPSGFQGVLARFEDDTGAKLVWDVRGSPFGSGSSAWHNFLKFLASPPPHPEQP